MDDYDYQYEDRTPPSYAQQPYQYYPPQQPSSPYYSPPQPPPPQYYPPQPYQHISAQQNIGDDRLGYSQFGMGNSQTVDIELEKKKTQLVEIWTRINSDFEIQHARIALLRASTETLAKQAEVLKGYADRLSKS